MTRLLLALPLLAACKGYPDRVPEAVMDCEVYTSANAALCKDTETPGEAPTQPTRVPTSTTSPPPVEPPTECSDAGKWVPGRRYANGGGKVCA